MADDFLPLSTGSLDSLNSEQALLELLNKVYAVQEAAIKKLQAAGVDNETILQATKLKNLEILNDKIKKYSIDANAFLIEKYKEGIDAQNAAELLLAEEKKKRDEERFAKYKKLLEDTEDEAEVLAFEEFLAKVELDEKLIKERERREDNLARRRQERYEQELTQRERLYEKYQGDRITREVEQDKAYEEFLYKRIKKKLDALPEDADEEAVQAAIDEATKEAEGKGGKRKDKIKKGEKNKQKQKDIQDESEHVSSGIKDSATRFKNAFAARDPNMTLSARWQDFKSLAQDGSGNFSLAALGANLINGIGTLATKLDKTIDESGKHQAGIDTRLYGSTSNAEVMGSYWRGLSGDIMAIAGASPLVLQTEIISSLEKLVGTGISHNVKLRAFLDTITDKIATTFEVTDNTMLRLIRLQQQDSTAARMGMESALNAFLNNMFETTEYLSKLADSVRGNLEEAQALMTSKQATEFEYQVQKWMGSMYSVGVSDAAVTSLSTTVGQLAAGQIEALTGSGTGNLMIMAANQAGISIADILKDGLDADTTNRLLEATVNYLAQIAKQSNSKVVQQQLAGVFGIKASDLKAIMNIANDNKTLSNITNTSVTNDQMLQELVIRAATMSSRVSVGEMITNLWENVQYSMAAGIANNPAMYGLYKMAGLMEQTIGGIAIPFMNVYGFGADLNITVANLMRTGAMAGGIMTSLPNMLAGLANMVGGASSMLMTAGFLTQGASIKRGDGNAGINALAKSGSSTSSSGLVGNASSSDMQSATMSDGQDDKDSMGAAAKEENEDATRDDIIEILKILFGMLGKKIDENTEAVKGSNSSNANSGTMGGFTNASTSMNAIR